MNTYTTKSGDTFDIIAFQELGDGRYTEKLINANRDKIQYFIFPAGIEISIPDIETDRLEKIPPWKARSNL